MRLIATLFVAAALVAVAGPGPSLAWLALNGGTVYHHVVEPVLVAVHI